MYFTDGFSFFFLSRHSGWRTSLFSRSVIPEEENRAGREARQASVAEFREITNTFIINVARTYYCFVVLCWVGCLLACFLLVSGYCVCKF